MSKRSGTSVQAGFTLVELLIVIVVIGILSAVTIPNIKTIIENIQLYTTVNGIKRQLICAKTRALGDSQLYCGVYFDTMSSPRKLQVFLDNGAPVNNGHYDAATDLRLLPAYVLPPTLTLSITDATGNSEIVYRGDGSTKVQGVIVTIKTSKNKIKKISVIPSTGRIRVTE